MKNYFWKKLKIGCIGFACSMNASAQITPDQVFRFISEEKYNRQEEVKFFYTRLSYHTAWVQSQNVNNRNIILDVLRSSASSGLDATDYPIQFIEDLNKGGISLLNSHDSLDAELRITAAVLQFYKDYAYGNTKPALGYNELKYTPGCRNIPDLLADYITGNKLSSLLTELFPVLPEIVLLEQKIKWFTRVMADSGFREVNITSNKVNWDNKSLVSKLYQLGIIVFPAAKINDSLMRLKVKEAQRQFTLLADGELRKTCLQELNVPLYTRMRQFNLSVNYYRWLYCLIQNQPVIVVNIPAAYLKVYQINKPILETRTIVGKPSTPTPTLASRVQEVILYPYWHVPHSIIAKELLPAIKRNPGIINAGNYQVLNSSGKIMNPHAINWQALSASNFPYIIRQSTGCDNALGLIKLNFYSPFGVYLHDTPNKNLFALNRRYFSHGCMRMENPMEVGHLVLKNNAQAIDTLEQKGCLRNQSPITVKADEQLPVIVWYNPAGIDSTGRVLFFEDVYKKFEGMKRK